MVVSHLSYPEKYSMIIGSRYEEVSRYDIIDVMFAPGHRRSVTYKIINNFFPSAHIQQWYVAIMYTLASGHASISKSS